MSSGTEKLSEAQWTANGPLLAYTLPDFCGQFRKVRKHSGVDLDMQHLGNDLRPAVNKVIPSVGDSEVAGSLLALGLAHEVKFAAIVQFPYDTVSRKDGVVRQRRAGRVLAHTGRIYDYAGRWHPG